MERSVGNEVFLPTFDKKFDPLYISKKVLNETVQDTHFCLVSKYV